MQNHRHRPGRWLAAGVATAVAVTPLGAAHAAPSDDAGPLGSAFASAAQEHDVPRDLLVALAWNESRLDGHDGKPSQARGYGLMHLVDNPTHRTLAQAAELTGLEESELRKDDAANITGAAAVLDALADDAGLGAGERDDLSAWLPLVDDFAGLEDQPARLHTESVATTLREGVRAEVAGETVAVSGQDVDPSEALEQLPSATKAAAADHPGAVSAPADPSNYSSGRSADIDSVVIHVTQGSYAGSISWFQNPEADVSAHYTIRSSDGEVTQSVAEADTAWHAGNHNARSVGIEHEGYVDDPAWFTESMYRSSAEVTKGIAARHGVPLDRDHVIGHSEAPGADHTDPGEHWDWAHYMDLVGGSDDGGGSDDPLTFGSYPTQREGSEGPHVTAVQTLLTSAGQDVGEVDGQFGPATDEGVRAFQTDAGLDADGVVGPATWTALLSAGETPALSSGSSGDDVKRLQRALTAALGETVDVDGEFGEATTAAVRSFQDDRGLDVDGKVGPKTWQALQGGA